MNLDEIKQLIATLESSNLKKIVYKKGDQEIHLEKEDRESSHPVHRGAQQVVVHSSSEPPSSRNSKKEEVSGTFVTSPMVGTFYSSPSPDQPSFVTVGDKVSPNTIVCIVEAMKVLNEVKAGVSGTVAEVLTENAHPVEFGTKLFKIT